jgi:hypothetical protein
MPGLLDQTDTAGGLSDEQLQSLMLGATTAEPAAAPDAAPDAAAAPTAEEPGFFDRLTRGISKAGMVLAGGDPGLTTLSPEQQRAAGSRALLNFGLSMLANSGPSYTPRNFGQILAAGLESAGRVPIGMEQMVAAQNAQNTELALKKGALQIQGLTAQARLEQLKLLRAQIAGGQKAVDDALGGRGGSPAPQLSPGGSYEDSVIGSEGQGKNPLSSATGPGQFVDDTWRAFATANPDLFKGMTPAQVMGARSDPELAAQLGPRAVTWLAQQNAPVLDAAGVTPSGQSLRIAHYIGAKPAAAVMQAPENAPVKDFVSAEAVKANPELATMTAGQLRQRYANTPNPGFLTTAAAKPPGTVLTAGPGVPTSAPGPAAAPPPVAPGATAPPSATSPTAAPAAAPDTPEIAAARLKLAATRTQQLQALKGLQLPNTAERVSQIETEYQKGQTELDKEARAQQDKISEERRAEETKAREAQRQQQLTLDTERQKSEFQLAREKQLEQLRATNQANQSYKTAALNLDTKRLEQFGTRADAGTNMIRDTRALQQIAIGMGPANKLLDTDAGKQIRDMLVTLKLGSPETMANMTQSQAWDRLIGGLFGDTHVQGLGNQTDREGMWLMNAWGGASQNPIDRLTQLAIVRKLAEERVKDNTDAQKLFRGPQQSLEGLEDRIAQRNSLFDRPTAPPTDEAAQRSYNASHPPGEPYYAWWEVGRKGSGNFKQFWTRNTLEKNPATGLRMEHLSADTTGGQ